jgi:hypothetical protein
MFERTAHIPRPLGMGLPLWAVPKLNVGKMCVAARCCGRETDPEREKSRLNRKLEPWPADALQLLGF